MAYWLLLDYALTRRWRTLAAMALVPALGFFVKQSLAIWVPLYCVYLLFFDAPRCWLRTAGFAATALAGLAVVLAGCCSLWGEPFWYWTMREMAGHVVLPLRSFQHLLAAWVYYAVGLFAGLVFLRPKPSQRLRGPWVIWLIFLLIQSYTSGIEWMLNHMGSGCLLAGIWFLAALARLWSARVVAISRVPSVAWARAVLGVGLVCLVFAGLGLIFMPVNPLPADAYRYVGEIEREFSGLPADKVLLDDGAWIYAREGVVAKDQSAGIGSRGSSRVKGDFSGILGRLKGHYYQKIMVRNLNGPGLIYDNRSGWWPQSTGIRQALRESYQEVGRIRAVQGETRFMTVSFEPLAWSATRNGFQEITILVPKNIDSAGAGKSETP